VIHGTNLLERLQSIKDAVDPNYMFDCNICIGNNAIFKSQEELDVLDTTPAEAALNKPASTPTEPAPQTTGVTLALSERALSTPVSIPIPSADVTPASNSAFFVAGYCTSLIAAAVILFEV
jgi:hypothetical protein